MGAESAEKGFSYFLLVLGAAENMGQPENAFG
jgi:hypothetical protein